MAEQWQGLVTSTLNQSIKGLRDRLTKHNPVFAKLKQQGKMSFGHSGKKLEWAIQKARPTPHVYNDMAGTDFERVNLGKIASLDWATYDEPGVLSELDKQVNKGRWALYNQFAELQQAMVDELEAYLPAQFLQTDGHLAANTGKYAGIPSLSGNSGVAMSDNKRLTNNDTYAGISTAYGDLGGSSDADPEYWQWSPLILGATESGWDTTQTWAYACLEILGFALTQLRDRQKNGMADIMFLMGLDDMEAVKQKIRGLGQVPMYRNEKSGQFDYGFPSLAYEGAEIVGTSDMPSNRVFGLNFRQIEYRGLHDQLIHKETSWEDKNTSTFRWRMRAWGQFMLHPKHVAVIETA